MFRIPELAPGSCQYLFPYRCQFILGEFSRWRSLLSQGFHCTHKGVVVSLSSLGHS